MLGSVQMLLELYELHEAYDSFLGFVVFMILMRCMNVRILVSLRKLNSSMSCERLMNELSIAAFGMHALSRAPASWRRSRP